MPGAMTGSKLAAQLTIRLGGRPLLADELARIWSARLELALGQSSLLEACFEDKDGAFSDGLRLRMGMALELGVDWGSSQAAQSLGRGKLTGYGARISVEGTQLRLVAHGPLHALQHGSLSAAYLQPSTGTLMSQAAQQHRVPLSARGAVRSMPHALVAGRSVARLLEEQAARSGLWLSESPTGVTVGPPDFALNPTPLRYGVELLELRVEANTFTPVTRVVVHGVAPVTRQPIRGEAGEGYAYGMVGADLSGSAAVRQAFGEVVLEVGDCPVRTVEEAQALARAKYNDRLFAFVTAQGRAVGCPTLKAGETVDIQDMGKHLSGPYLLTRVAHMFRPGEGFSTTFEACRPALKRGP